MDDEIASKFRDGLVRSVGPVDTSSDPEKTAYRMSVSRDIKAELDECVARYTQAIKRVANPEAVVFGDRIGDWEHRDGAVREAAAV